MNPTGEQLADYFGEISHNDADIKRIIGFFLISAIWILVVVYLTKGDRIKEYFKRVFNSKNTEPRPVSSNVSNGYVYDVNNNEILTMDMNPINEDRDIFVPKYKGNGESSLANNNKTGKYDSLTEINTLVNLLVKNDRPAVFDYLKKLVIRGIAIESLAENVVLELDKVLEAKVSGDTNRSNIVLSQIASHWSKEKLELVVGSFLSIMDTNYSNKALGAQVALLKIMKN